MKVGDVVDGKYQLVRLIGEGGMGAVFEAVHVRIRSKRAAVKVLHPDLATNAELIARFEREAEAAAALRPIGNVHTPRSAAGTHTHPHEFA